VYFRAFYDVLQSLLILHQNVVRQPTPSTPLAHKIYSNRRFTPYFDDYIGALDGTHIAISVPLQEQPRYRNRKHFLSQNVLAVYDFDLFFVYVLPGWEGSAHDQRVLSDALCRHRLEVPKGKYYLGDVGYSNTEYCLVPYRGTRYHIKEQYQAGLK